ncbi:DUF4287 domain-containing protein [Phenylobacterium sp.]|jgi:hypothetical protein|uniref:DUF4287 domain-containing protein n=1 Tax=Phenylobacterium sp. TaxID=1871053 RepID=UPI002E349940|nr:DUF4287 domain-containing protein [Phenylobacterium sp.]HEX4711440.1 DUF4287 domain-containing protein [Phenylobacterium sp.]
MSFQAYLDTIKAKTGKGPDDFKALAQAKGLAGPDVKAGAVLAWLKQDYGLGHGHGMAIYSILKTAGAPETSGQERLERLFSGGKAAWRAVLDRAVAQLGEAGAAVELSTTAGYVSLLRNGRKFAILSPAAGHLDIGLKRTGAPFTPRFVAAGTWNAMVTHRVRLADAAELDRELLDWLLKAYQERA